MRGCRLPHHHEPRGRRQRRPGAEGQRGRGDDPPHALLPHTDGTIGGEHGPVLPLVEPDAHLSLAALVPGEERLRLLPRHLRQVVDVLRALPAEPDLRVAGHLFPARGARARDPDLFEERHVRAFRSSARASSRARVTSRSRRRSEASSLARAASLTLSGSVSPRYAIVPLGRTPGAEVSFPVGQRAPAFHPAGVCPRLLAPRRRFPMSKFAPRSIQAVAHELGLRDEDIELYGRGKAKIELGGHRSGPRRQGTPRSWSPRSTRPPRAKGRRRRRLASRWGCAASARTPSSRSASRRSAPSSASKGGAPAAAKRRSSRRTTSTSTSPATSTPSRQRTTS